MTDCKGCLYKDTEAEECSWCQEGSKWTSVNGIPTPFINSTEETLTYKRDSTISDLISDIVEQFDESPFFEVNGITSKYDYYNHTYKGITLDPYRVAKCWGITEHPQFHAWKKIGRAHLENHKDMIQNINEAIDSLERWKEILKEDEEN